MDITYIALVIGVILISMTLHEAMHAFMGYFLGDDTAKLEGRLTLNPIKHIDPFLTLLLPVMLAIVGGPIFGGAKPVPFNPNRVRYGEWGAAMVALAGPLTNLILAFTAFGIGVVSGVITGEGIIGNGLGQALWLFIIVNLGFFIFNMIPLPPLDGSRVLYALAPEFVRRGMEAIERFGIMFIFLIVILSGSLIGVLMTTLRGGVIEIFQLVFML